VKSKMDRAGRAHLRNRARGDDDNVVVIFGTQHGRYASLPVEHEDKDYAFELLQHNV